MSVFNVQCSITTQARTANATCLHRYIPEPLPVPSYASSALEDTLDSCPRLASVEMALVPQCAADSQCPLKVHTQPTSSAATQASSAGYQNLRCGSSSLPLSPVLMLLVLLQA